MSTDPKNGYHPISQILLKFNTQNELFMLISVRLMF